MSNMTEQQSGEDSLGNRRIRLDIRDINFNLTSLFKDYQVSLNRIMGDELFGKSQVRQIQDANGVMVKYGKGTIKVKNSIDRMKFLLSHREQVSEAIGVSSSELYKNRRQYGKMSQYVRMLDQRYELGDLDLNMQLYISKHDGNTSQLDSTMDWIDYILTSDWVRKLAAATIGDSSGNLDHRISYLSQLVQGMMKDHEIDFHGVGDEDGGTIDFDQYLDKPTDEYQDAFNRLNSFFNLQYGFYEMFKPIGGTTEKYVKVHLRTNGMVEISGVVGLSDCEHIEWEYGSKEYLRSLNTGNQMYDFKLSIPFNDGNSYLWWRPDDKEELPDQEEVEEESKQYRYYKVYEVERFLRWFGTTYVPLLDMDGLTRKTVCSAPVVSNDAQIGNIFSDANNLTSPDMSAFNIDNSTSLSLLSLQPTSTIDLIQKEDGQYLRFVVSGHRQTSNLAFKVCGKLFPMIQEENHYFHTMEAIINLFVKITKYMTFLELSRLMRDPEDKKWNKEHPGEEYVPQDWVVIQERL